MTYLISAFAYLLLSATSAVYTGHIILIILAWVVVDVATAASLALLLTHYLDYLIFIPGIIVLGTLVGAAYLRVWGFPPVGASEETHHRWEAIGYALAGILFVWATFVPAELGYSGVMDVWVGEFVPLIVAPVGVFASYIITSRNDWMKLGGNGAKLHRGLCIFLVLTWASALLRTLLLDWVWIYLPPLVIGILCLILLMAQAKFQLIYGPRAYEEIILPTV